MPNTMMHPEIAENLRDMYARMTLSFFLETAPKMFSDPHSPQALETVLGGLVDGVKMLGIHTGRPLIETLVSLALDQKE